MAVLVHFLLIAPLALGGLGNKRPPPPDQPGAGASALKSSSAATESMILVDLLNTQQSATVEPLEALSSEGLTPPSTAFLLLSPELSPPPEFEIEDEEVDELAEAAGDTKGHAALFGRYLGQITARIERSWRRPRTQAVDQFACQVKIEQDQRGKVLSVELRQCGSDARWQLSLVSAIEHASPLPAPPIPSVYSRLLLLSFRAKAWQDGVSNPHAYQAAEDSSTHEPNEIDVKHSTPKLSLAEAAKRGGQLGIRGEGGSVSWSWSASTPGSEIEQAQAMAQASRASEQQTNTEKGREGEDDAGGEADGE